MNSPTIKAVVKSLESRSPVAGHMRVHGEIVQGGSGRIEFDAPFDFCRIGDEIEFSVEQKAQPGRKKTA